MIIYIREMITGRFCVSACQQNQTPNIIALGAKSTKRCMDSFVVLLQGNDIVAEWKGKKLVMFVIKVGNVGDGVSGVGVVGNNDEVDECGFEESLRG